MRRISILPILFSLFISCDRQDLEEKVYTHALLPVLIDWESKALLYVDNDTNGDLYSASVWLFPTATSEYQGDAMEFKLSDPELGYIEVPVGEYDVLVFNKTVSDFTSNVGFRGTDKFDTFEYYINEDSRFSLFSSRSDSDITSLAPDMLAAWSMEDGGTLVVTQGMLGYYEEIVSLRSRYSSTKATVDDFADLSDDLKQLLYVTPERLIHNVTLVETVWNMNNATAAQATLKGMSTSVNLSKKSYSTTTTSHVVTFTTKDYLDDLEFKHGTMSGSTNVVGPLDEDSSYSVETLFTLASEYDGSLIYPTPPADPYTADVSSQVNEAIIGLDKCFSIYIDIGIELPELQVEIEDSGFSVNVSDWGETIVIPM
ncbi:MAG: DUF5119 domain-containing protein [Rikenellaceae bacterium]